MKHGPLVVRPKLDPVMWVWLLKMLRNCTTARSRCMRRISCAGGRIFGALNFRQQLNAPKSGWLKRISILPFP